jgi:hypothetical protein
MDIKTLREMRNKSAAGAAKINEAFAKMGKPSYEDDRFWKVSRDKTGNGSAVIRFLPITVKEIDGKRVEDELPFVRIYSHAFKGVKTGQWYMEKNLTTIGLDDPVSELNSQLWATGKDSDKEIARAQKRRLKYVANILVVSDPAAPETNGTVRLFEFGAKIFDKIMDKANPTFDDEKSQNIFDLWDGADFKLRVKTVEGFPNYDSSEFGPSKPISEDDEEILKIVNKQYLLSELIDPKNFKTYAELKARLDRVLGNNVKSKRVQEDSGDDDSFEEEFESLKLKAKETTKKSSEEDDDDTEAWFRSIAEEDE